MSETPPAVFISYASQDVEAAAQICAALRAAGIEVWFDRNELRGGDAWDQSIRKQIRECTLFVPVISANTQARAEGYFRLEWKLAVDRSHLMADDQPFLVPVVIDDTPESTARVPDRFRDVQWTRLVMTETPTAFAQRMQAILSADAGRGLTNPPSTRTRGQSARSGIPALQPSPVRRWLAPAAGVLAVVIAIAFWVVSRPGGTTEKSAVNATLPAHPLATPPLTENRRLIERARALYEPWDGATREDFASAEALVKRALDLDQTEGDAWAALAILSCGKMMFGHDRTPARRETARSAAERAIKLAPDSNQARFAQAFYFRFQDSTAAEAERLLREVVEREPTNTLMICTLAGALRNRGQGEEALALYDRAIALPGGAPLALYNKYLVYKRIGRQVEAEAAIDQGLAAGVTAYNYRAKINCLVEWHGDLDRAAEMAGKMPPAYLGEDGGAYCAARLWLWRRDTKKCLAVLAAMPRDILEQDFTGPKAYFAGQAHRVAGNLEAAQTEWRTALQVTERQLASQPNATTWVFWKAYLLALTGRLPEAEQALRTFEQLTGRRGWNDSTAIIYLLLGQGRDAIIEGVAKSHERTRQSGNAGILAQFENNLRFDPTWDELRTDERFTRLVASFTSPQKFTPAAVTK